LQGGGGRDRDSSRFGCDFQVHRGTLPRRGQLTGALLAARRLVISNLVARHAWSLDLAVRGGGARTARPPIRTKIAACPLTEAARGSGRPDRPPGSRGFRFAARRES